MLKVHHIGLIVSSIDSYIEDSFFEINGRKIYDPIQSSNLCLLKTNNDFFIELIEPLNEQATTFKFLKNNGGGYHHICYLIKEKDLVSILQKNKIKLFWGPKPAILFGNKKVAFGMSKYNEIIEFLLD